MPRTTSFGYRPERILIETGAEKWRFCRHILAQFPRIVPETVASPGERTLSGNAHPVRGKKTLLLKSHRGTSVKLCPGFSQHSLCCQYYVIDLIENCPLACTYCILQAFLNHPAIVFHVNVEEILERTIALIRSQPKRSFRIGTGEHSDSLALDAVFPVNALLVEAFSKLSNATLELKTKTAAIQPLLGLNHQDRTVVAWSLNPEIMIRQNEFKTASLVERLEAASRVVEDGYRTAFHFDPMIAYPGWREGYRRLVEMLFDYVRPADIAWISLGTLRYLPVLKQIAEERFPRTTIFCHEFILAEDGKMRYLKRIRREMLQAMVGWLRSYGPNIPLYLCMEKPALWASVFPNHPPDAEALERYLCGRA